MGHPCLSFCEDDEPIRWQSKDRRPTFSVRRCPDSLYHRQNYVSWDREHCEPFAECREVYGVTIFDEIMHLFAFVLVHLRLCVRVHSSSYQEEQRQADYESIFYRLRHGVWSLLTHSANLIIPAITAKSSLVS